MKKGIATIQSFYIFWNITNFVHVTNGFAITRSVCRYTKLFASRHNDYSSYDNTSSSSSSRSSSSGMNFIERDADFGEILAGGQRYEMVELPDSMLDTTIFVGNLCEVSSYNSKFLVFFV